MAPAIEPNDVKRVKFTGGVNQYVMLYRLRVELVPKEEAWEPDDQVQALDPGCGTSGPPERESVLFILAGPPN